MKLWVGTSGYSYKEWLGKFYPERMSPKHMLGFYAARFSAVEINNTFYRLPKEGVLQSWARQVPPEFSFVLKAPRIITHRKRLKDAGAEIEYLFRVTTALERHTVVVLFQLPPNMKKDMERLEKFLTLLPSGRAAAFEFRHPSWFDDDIVACLRSRNCALCVADTDESESGDWTTTATWGYLRLRRAEYSDADLLQWKERILAQSWNDAFIFFKHEDGAKGPRFAAKFLENSIKPG